MCTYIAYYSRYVGGNVNEIAVLSNIIIIIITIYLAVLNIKNKNLYI
jgi:hypothetical protein